MAVSYSHRFGQIIGDVLELAVEPFLYQFSLENNMFLDKKGNRSLRQGKKLSWSDINGNNHDLDYVLERNGSDIQQGTPAAFIECAWRRYTKHSKNKAQEIQGAIIPLREKYKNYNPFIGVILAGEFTSNSLEQLRSLGFHILFISYEKICLSFSVVGIDANFNEKTSEDEFKSKVMQWENLPDEVKEKVYAAIAENNLIEISNFLGELKANVDRTIARIKIWTIFGKEFVFTELVCAKSFILTYEPSNGEIEFMRFEFEIEYLNGDSIKASFGSRTEFLSFLTQFV